VGNDVDWIARATSTVSAAVGSFDSVTGVTMESELDANGVPIANSANSFSLQLNTNFFTTSACSCDGAADPSACQQWRQASLFRICDGWQQFVFSNSGVAFIQYWLLSFGPNCPTTGGGATGWLQTPIAPNDCFANSMVVLVPAQTIANLAQVRLTGQVNSGGTDTVIMSTGGSDLNAAGHDSVLNLAQAWNAAEFNIFGDCCFHEATFNDGSTLVVRISVNDGSTTAPSCGAGGFTGETNNLNLVGTPAVVPQETLPAIVFTESNAAGGAPASCSSSSGLTCREQCQLDFETCVEESGRPPAPTPAQCRAALRACNAHCPTP
jgi:hypothetical protein